MNTITLEDLQARHTELGKLIESFKAVLPTTLHIPDAHIELRQGERYAGLILNDQGLPNHHQARPQAWPLTTEACEAGRIGAT